LSCHATAGCRPAPKLICTGGWPRLALAPALLHLAEHGGGSLAHGRTRIRCFPGRAAAVARRPAPALVCARAWERLVLAPAPGGGSSPAPARGKEGGI